MINDKHIRVYTIYHQDGTIHARYEREPSSLDGQEIVDNISNFFPVSPSQRPEENKVLPTYYGEWRETPPEEIARLNEIILSKKLSSKLSSPTGESRPAKELTDYEKRRELEIKQAEELLKALRTQETELKGGESK